MTEAISIVEVHTLNDNSESLARLLTELADSIRNTPGCLAYQSLPSHSRRGLWIITGLWESSRAMESHFSHPALTGVIDLLTRHRVNKILVSGFPKAA